MSGCLCLPLTTGEPRAVCSLPTGGVIHVMTQYVCDLIMVHSLLKIKQTPRAWRAFVLMFKKEC